VLFDPREYEREGEKRKEEEGGQGKRGKNR
jgi:hypothetical protein